MIKTNSRDIILVEDHHQAYYAWRERRISNMPLVHMDAHIDFGFQEVKDIPLIVNEAKTLSELKAQLERALLFRQKKFDIEKLTDIGNYIYPAMREGIVSEFYWVIPGNIDQLEKSLADIKRILKDLKKNDPRGDDGVCIERGYVRSTLYGRQFSIIVLETMPVLDMPVLLDIDTDFLLMNSLKEADPFKNIGRRRPWIAADDFISRVREKVIRPAIITIAYSVRGGYTPMIYKTVGDELARGFGYSDARLNERLRAGEYFQNFRLHMERRDYERARLNYLAAIGMNPSYREKDNNYAPLYFEAQDYVHARKEWCAMLKVDGDDIGSLCGLGRIHLVKKRYHPAKKYFEAALASDPRHPESIIGLAEVEIHQKNYRVAQELLYVYETLVPIQSLSRFLSGLIQEKLKNPQGAFVKYWEAMQLGMNHIDLFLKLIILSRRCDPKRMNFVVERYKEYNKSFYRKIRKQSLKSGMAGEVRKIERKMFKFEKLLGIL